MSWGSDPGDPEGGEGPGVDRSPGGGTSRVEVHERTIERNDGGRSRVDSEAIVGATHPDAEGSADPAFSTLLTDGHGRPIKKASADAQRRADMLLNPSIMPGGPPDGTVSIFEVRDFYPQAAKISYK